MPQISKTDLDEIFADAEIADTVTIAGNSVQGHFLQPYENAVDIAGTAPTFRCEATAASTAGAARGIALVHSATNYTIQQVQADSAGTVLMILSKD